MLIFCVLLSVPSALSLSDREKISALEARVTALETTLSDLEPLLVSRYGLIRHCLVPEVHHGVADCPDQLGPGVSCTVVCDQGYIATPGKEVTICKEDGFWTQELQCEVPLVLVGGGAGDSGVELLSFYPSQGCDKNIAELPLTESAARTLHTMVYVPPRTVLACNGMTGNVATCDALDILNNTWQHHSHPNKGSKAADALCEISPSMYSCRKNPDRKKGRYASESLHVGGKTIILGGMVYDDNGHEPSDSVRRLGKDGLGINWASLGRNMEKKRAFFCAVKVRESAFLAIGGLGQGQDGQGNVVEQSVEYRGIKRGEKKMTKAADMSIPRSGHGCAGVPGDNLSFLVSGGTTGFGKNALTYSEIFSLKENSWKNVAQMKTGRFGHAVVAVGEKIFAIGGDEKNPSNLLDTIEEYDVKKNSWKIITSKLKKPRANFGYTLIPHSILPGCTVSRPLDE